MIAVPLFAARPAARPARHGRRPQEHKELPAPARAAVARVLLRVLRHPARLPVPVRGRDARSASAACSTGSTSATSPSALDSLYIDVFLRTLRTAAIGTLLIILVGYPLAYWIARYAPDHRRGLFLALIIIPFWTSFLIRTYSFLIVLSPEFFLSDWLAVARAHRRAAATSSTRRPRSRSASSTTTCRCSCCRSTRRSSGWTGGSSTPRPTSARRQWAAFRQITLRLTAPGLITGTLLVFIPMMGEYVIPLVLGGGRVDFIGNVIQRTFLEAQDYALGSALAMLVMGALSFFVALYLYLSHAHGAGVRCLSSLRKLGAFLGALALRRRADRRRRLPRGPGRRRGVRAHGRSAPCSASPRSCSCRAASRCRALLGGYSALVYVFLFVPILVVVIYAFNSGRNVAVVRGLLDEVVRAGARRRHDHLVDRALVPDRDRLGAHRDRVRHGGGARALAREPPGAHAVRRRSSSSRSSCPELVIAISSLIFFVNVGFELGLVTMFLAHTVFNASLVLLIVRARFVSMGSTLEEASRDLGASALGDVPPGDAAAARAGDRGRRDALVHVLVRRRRDLQLHGRRRQRHVAAADPLRPALRPAPGPQRRGDDDARASRCSASAARR